MPGYHFFVKLRRAVLRACLSLIVSGLVMSGDRAIAQDVSSKDSPNHDVPVQGQAATGKEPPAQDAPRANPPLRAHRRSRPTLDDQVKLFSQKLELNERQQFAVRRILEQRQMATLQIRQDSSISGEERIERFRALQDQTVYRIRSVLSDEQKKKYDPLAVRRVPEAPERRSVDDWLKDITPK